MTLLDAAILGTFAVYAVASGLRARRLASRGLDDYFLAGRSLSGTQAGVSMAATQFAADTPLLVTGLIATAGIFSLWRLWIYALAFLLMGFVLAASWRRSGVLTDAELSERRYGGGPALALRIAKAFYFGTLFNCVVLAMVLFATKEIAEPFLTWDHWLPESIFDPLVRAVRSLGVSFAREGPGLGDASVRSANNLLSITALVSVTALYSTTGGLRSVVRTDIAQFGVMLVATAVYAAWVVSAAGGLDAIDDAIRARFDGRSPGGLTASQLLAFTPGEARDAGFAVLAMLGLQWLLQINSDGTGYLAQRSMACRSDSDARHAAVVFVVLQILVRSLLWLPLGLGLLVLFPPDPSLGQDALVADREATYVRGIRELLPPGLVGLLLTGMLAALASTLDTHLNWGASYWTNDLYKRVWCESLQRRDPSPRGAVWVARASTFGILAIALVVMTQLGSIQGAWRVSLLLGAGVGVVLVLRWLWWRMNAWGELVALGTSAVLAPVLLSILPGEQEAARLLAVSAGSTLFGVAAALATAPEDDALLRTFYERARPPGWWGPVAIAAGRDPRSDTQRLGRGLAAVAIAGFSIFSLLTGCGSLLVGSPPPAWFPLREAWIASLLVIGTALVPVWWRLGRRSAP